VKYQPSLRACILAVVFLVTAAVGALAQEDVDSGPMPDWVKARPQDTDQLVYFSGMGFSAKGHLVEALEFANIDIQTQIVKFVGVRVTSTTSIEAKGNLDEFKANISKQIKETGSMYQAGFRLDKRPWSEKSARGLTVYILCSYDKESLLKEKKRIEDIFQTLIDAVRLPEEAGGKLAADGRYYEAALRYIEAAVAAGESTLEDRDVALNRNLANALAAVEKINLVKLNDNLTGTSGAEPELAFQLKAAGGPTASDKGVPNTAILVTYFTAPASGSTLIAKTVSVKTDDQGVLSFRHPVLTFAGKGKIGMRLDLDAYLEKLRPVEKQSPDKIAALARLANSRKQEFLLTALAPAKSLSLAVFVVDVDESGAPLAANQATASGLSEALTQQGFKLKTAKVDTQAITGMDEEELAALILLKVPGAQRAVVGVGLMTGSDRDGDRFIITVTGTVKVIDLTTKKTMYEKTAQKKYVGTSLEAGRTAAFKQLGNDLGLKIAADVK
jgi:hypothetical protein